MAQVLQSTRDWGSSFQLLVSAEVGSVPKSNHLSRGSQLSSFHRVVIVAFDIWATSSSNTHGKLLEIQAEKDLGALIVMKNA